MRPRSVPSARSALAASLVSALLAGCAGGGAQSVPSAFSGDQLDARAGGVPAARSEAIANPYPEADGDVFVYAYAETDSTKTSGGTTTTTTSAKDTIRIEGNKTFDGKSLTQYLEDFAYTVSSGGSTLATGTNSSTRFRTFASVDGGKNLDYDSYGDRHTYVENYADGDGFHESGLTNYGADSPYELDILPETKDQAWNPQIGYLDTFSTKRVKSGVTTTETEKYTEKDDGSYTRDFTSSTPGEGEFKETDSENSDGSAADDNNGQTISTAGDTTFSAPTKSGAKYVITVVYKPPTGSQSTTEVPDWFPGNGPLEHFATDARKDLGTAKVPAGCGKASAGKTAEVLSEFYTFLDAVLGTYETDDDTTYVVSGEGSVCVTQTRITKTYDNRDTGALVSTETVEDTTGLTSETLKKMLDAHLTAGFAPSPG